MEDTITAIATSLGVGAISIIRVSGSEAINIVNKITKFKKLALAASHTIHYDYIISDNHLIDEVLITVMLAPKTFTKEDIVEINCHGGIATTNKILELLLINGCRLAQPGEFTKRAFLNGRIDLIEAEGVMDLINSKTDKARSLALNQIKGKVSQLIENLRQQILEILANIEVNIDYPEYEDIEQVTNKILLKKIINIEQQINDIIIKSENGIIVKEGINVALVGRPNVGKSSLLNCLLETNKAIVTSIAGTTRDCVEGTLIIDGIVFNLIDTAGIRKTDDLVEKIGVTKSIDLIDEASLILLLLNGNESLQPEDIELLNKLKNKNYIVVVNKNDLEIKLDINKLDINKTVYISALNNEGIDTLKNKIKEIFNLEQIETDDLTYLSNARCLSLLKQSYQAIGDLKQGINNNLPIDILEIDLKNIWNLLGSIIGQTYEDELIDQLFSQFCLGK
ncbi:MAG: tRNA uridine-5-carboxymethylaminomethyl(34) synthesis GTPase MnmE [Bacilli bacterium]